MVNTTYQAAPWADLLYACDETWWQHHYPKLATVFSGELWTISEAARERHGLRWIFGQEGSGLSPDPTYIHTGMNSGYQALGLAALFGARRIVLLGYDFTVGPGGRRHWHGDHPRPLGNAPPSRYPAWANAMNVLATDLKRSGVEVINASRRTALRCFPRRDLTEALCG